MLGCKLVHIDSVRPYAEIKNKSCYFAMMPRHIYCVQAVAWGAIAKNLKESASLKLNHVIGSFSHDDIFGADVSALISGLSAANESHISLKNSG